MTTLTGRLVFLNRYTVRICVCVVAHTGDLPRNANEGLVCSNNELIISYLLGDNRLGELSDNSKLVAEVLIKGFKVGREPHCGEAISVSGNVPVVNVHHVWGLDEGMRKI